eukprot:12737356-Alexandrium_andersonii.AAC.1
MRLRDNSEARRMHVAPARLYHRSSKCRCCVLPGDAQELARGARCQEIFCNEARKLRADRRPPYFRRHLRAEE